MLPARLQMSDPRADEGPGSWSPEAGRESAGGVGDGPGVEGSQAAASGTQGRGTGGWAPPGLRAPHLGARLGRVVLCVAGWSGPAGPARSRAEPVCAPARAPLPRAMTPAAATPRALVCARGSFLRFRMPGFPLCFLSQISPDGSDRAALPLAPLQLQHNPGSLLGCRPQPRWPRSPALALAPHPDPHFGPQPQPFHAPR